MRHISDSSIELKNGTEIFVATNNFRSIRGRTVGLAILDECAYWRSDEYANPDSEVYAALLPALATLRQSGAMIIGISTVYRRSGLLFNKWLRHHGRDDPNVLVIRQPSAVYNPTLNEPALAAEIAEDIAADPERGAAEWLGEWRTDLADFVDRADSRDRWSSPAGSSCRVSPAHSTSPSLTLAAAAPIPSLWPSPTPPPTARAYWTASAKFARPSVQRQSSKNSRNTLRAYGVTVVHGDRYAGEWPRERFALAGISYEPLEKTKSEPLR